MFDKKKDGDTLWAPEPIAIPPKKEEFQTQYMGKWVYGADRAKLIDIIKSTPKLARTAGSAERIADHLLANGVRVKHDDDFVARLSHNGQQVDIRFEANQVAGVMELNGEKINVYIASEKAEQLGRLDVSTLAERKRTDSIIKRIFTLIEV